MLTRQEHFEKRASKERSGDENENEKDVFRVITAIKLTLVNKKHRSGVLGIYQRAIISSYPKSILQNNI